MIKTKYIDLKTLTPDMVDASYGFRWSDEFEGLSPQNVGVHSSAAYIKIPFEAPSENTKVTIEYWQSSENKYDYGIISRIDQYLSSSNVADSSALIVGKSIAGVDGYGSYTATASAGSHFITLKYRKDTTQNVASDVFVIKSFKIEYESSSAESFWSGGIQTATVVFTPNESAVGQSSLTITESDIIELTVDRTSVSSDALEIGSAVAAMCKLKLRNFDKKYSNVLFEGGEIDVTVSCDGADTRMGVFIINDTPRPLSTIEIEALDRMVLFDFPCEISDNTMSVQAMIRECCQACHVTLFETGLFNSSPNKSASVRFTQSSTETKTYRNVIQACAEILGGIAVINPNGLLEIREYKCRNADVELNMSNRYNSDLRENDIIISGVKYTYEKQSESGESSTETYLAGTDDYAFDVSKNILLANMTEQSAKSVLNGMFSVVGTIVYRPFNAAILPTPWVYPADAITFVDKESVSHNSTVTSIVFTMNGGTSIASQGRTAQQSAFKRSDLTRSQAQALEALRTQIRHEVTNREQAVITLNEALANASGLQTYTEQDATGGLITYLYDVKSNKTPPYVDSNVVLKLNAAGIGISLDGGQTYTSGYNFATQEAIVNVLQTVGVKAEWIKVESGESLFDVEIGARNLIIHSETLEYATLELL